MITIFNIIYANEWNKLKKMEHTHSEHVECGSVLNQHKVVLNSNAWVKWSEWKHHGVRQTATGHWELSVLTSYTP